METEIKDIWQNGHHKRVIIDSCTGEVIADTYETYHISHEEHEVRKQCRQSFLLALQYLFGKVLTNKDCNMKARFSKNTANKLASDKVITKSVVNGFLPQDHFEAAENIKGIFEFAEYLGTFPDDSNDPNIIAIHRFQKCIQLSNGRDCVAYITLKEVKKEGSRIYTQELLLNEYPPHEAGELTSRDFKRSESVAYKCNPRTRLSVHQDNADVNVNNGEVKNEN